MLRIYEAQRNQFQTIEKIDALVLNDDMAWLDLLNPTREEEKILEQKLGLELPTREEMRDIEPSSRLYEENGVLYMTANVVWKADVGQPETANVGFILTPKHLITIRYSDPRPFVLFNQYAKRQGNICLDAASTLIALLEAIIDRLAEILEITGAETDAVNVMVFSPHPDLRKRRSTVELEIILRRIAYHQNMIAKARDSLVSLGRMVSFIAHAPDLKTSYGTHISSASRDIQSLTDHASFLANNLTFMLDASLGLINIEQNAIIKIFSVAAVVFLPPTLVASIYGMNFHQMPELSWRFGYPLAILLMVFSAVAPYVWFKKKGWL